MNIVYIIERLLIAYGILALIFNLIEFIIYLDELFNKKKQEKMILQNNIEFACNSIFEMKERLKRLENDIQRNIKEA